jgi:glycosyltransferase involved in cell wall biosynthesis
VRALLGNKPVWYEAQDVEIDLKRGVLPAGSVSDKLLTMTQAVEHEVITRANCIICCSEQDAIRLQELYGVDRGKLMIAPNGTAIDLIPFIKIQRRSSIKERLGLKDITICFFIGSWHGPNLEAIEAIIGMANEMSDLMFWVVGSAGRAFQGRLLPHNLLIFGEVSDEEKTIILETADIGLNPMSSGSGTNLKMAEYLAAGMPVVSTPIGSRGFEKIQSDLLRITELETFTSEIRKLTRIGLESLEDERQHIRAEIEQNFSWHSVAGQLVSDLTEHIQHHPSRVINNEYS